VVVPEDPIEDQGDERRNDETKVDHRVYSKPSTSEWIYYKEWKLILTGSKHEPPVLGILCDTFVLGLFSGGDRSAGVLCTHTDTQKETK
jgi:hypothetical protein